VERLAYLLTHKPAVLLLGPETGHMAIIHALNKDYRIEPLVYSESRPGFVPGLLRYDFKRIKHPGNEYYTIHTLLDFSSSSESRQTVLLVPCTYYYEEMIARNTGLLEPYFIIKPAGDLIEALPTLTRKAKKKVRTC
jgi:predicted ATP-grasp superfamily ATP-dependent carboligase